MEGGGGLKTAVADKWKSSLSRHQIGVIEQVAGETLRSEGYDLTGEKTWVSPLHRTYYKAHQIVMSNYAWQKRNSWAGVKRRLGLSSTGAAKNRE